MTNKEALESLMDKAENGYVDIEEVKLVFAEMQSNSGEDCISRQAVLDGIEELKRSPWCTDKRGIGFEYLITEALEVVADLCVKREPSVTPKPKTDVLDKIRAEISEIPTISFDNDVYKADILEIIDKYKAESEDKK